MFQMDGLVERTTSSEVIALQCWAGCCGLLSAASHLVGKAPAHGSRWIVRVPISACEALKCVSCLASCTRHVPCTVQWQSAFLHLQLLSLQRLLDMAWECP
mmetsp:Transcript_101480/g.291210  ORF Transcript_101480/g.291210 Transcript_101480/m.291210 type:complete len:101 (-) Transcript_101480:64-366(-)